MLNLKDYGSSSDEEPSENITSNSTIDNTINVNELSKKFAVNAAPDVFPPVNK